MEYKTEITTPHKKIMRFIRAHRSGWQTCSGSSEEGEGWFREYDSYPFGGKKLYDKTEQYIRLFQLFKGEEQTDNFLLTNFLVHTQNRAVDQNWDFSFKRKMMCNTNFTIYAFYKNPELIEDITATVGHRFLDSELIRKIEENGIFSVGINTKNFEPDYSDQMGYYMYEPQESANICGDYSTKSEDIEFAKKVAEFARKLKRRDV